MAAFLPAAGRDDLVDRVRAGWDVHPARLLHLAERERWEASRAQGSYLPAEWGADGFIHLSARHQLLTPANRFYRGTPTEEDPGKKTEKGAGKAKK